MKGIVSVNYSVAPPWTLGLLRCSHEPSHKEGLQDALRKVHGN